MHHPSADIETYVNPIHLRLIRFDFKCIDQILLKSNASSKKAD